MFGKELLIKAATVGVASFVLVILQGTLKGDAVQIDLNALVNDDSRGLEYEE